MTAFPNRAALDRTLRPVRRFHVRGARSEVADLADAMARLLGAGATLIDIAHDETASTVELRADRTETPPAGQA